jgi:hypothetical protein
MARSSLRRPRRIGSVLVAGLAAASGGVVLALAVPAGSALADTPPYELYCPGTAVGNVVLNDVVTSGTITPASVASGGTFNLTNYQTVAKISGALANAAAAFGSTLAGSATVQVDATGATPANIAPPTANFSSPIPSPVPASGIVLNIPSPPGTVGPFTATGGAISLKVDSSAKLTLLVSGSPLNITCSTYANNTAPSGITTTPPSGSPTSPVIATATASCGSAPAATPTTAPPTAATTAPTTATPSTTALTGPGPHLWLLAAIGAVLLCLGTASLFFTVGSRSRFRRGLRSADLQTATGPAQRPLWIEGSNPGRTPGGRADDLWITGWEPEDSA